LDEKRTVTTDFSLIWSSSEDVTEYKSYFSLPEFIEFPTVIPGQHAYAYFYAPYSHSFQGPSDEKPPLLVRTHGTFLVLFFKIPKAHQGLFSVLVCVCCTFSLTI
jgi:hypothetical protein